MTEEQAKELTSELRRLNDILLPLVQCHLATLLKDAKDPKTTDKHAKAVRELVNPQRLPASRDLAK